MAFEPLFSDLLQEAVSIDAKFIDLLDIDETPDTMLLDDAMVGSVQSIYFESTQTKPVLYTGRENPILIPSVSIVTQFVDLQDTVETPDTILIDDVMAGSVQSILFGGDPQPLPPIGGLTFDFFGYI
jgi:hypothetical protein